MSTLKGLFDQARVGSHAAVPTVISIGREWRAATPGSCLLPDANPWFGNDDQRLPQALMRTMQTTANGLNKEGSCL